MLTLKWTQTSGVISIIETRTAAVIPPRTPAFDEYKKENPDFLTDNIRGVVLYDGGSIPVFVEDARLYIVNENGKTVQTV